MFDGVAEPTKPAVAEAVAAVLDQPVTGVEPLPEGMNAVYRVAVEGDRDRDRDQDREVVLKAGTAQSGPELLSGPLLAERLARETTVPAPEIVASVTADESPIGVAYVVMGHVEGRHLTDVRELSPPAHERFVREAGTHLAAVHDLDYEGQYGRLVAEDGAFSIDYAFDDWASMYRSVVEWNRERIGERFADLDPLFETALDAFESHVDERAVDQSILYRDYHAKNLVFAPDDAADPLVRAVLDFNYRPVGDAPLDVAVAETTLVDTPLDATDRGHRADDLRETLRSAYVDARGGVRAEHFDACYPAYRLLSVLDHLHYFDYFQQFAPPEDPGDVADWLRGFVRARVDELTDAE